MASRQDDPSAATAQPEDATAQQDNATAQRDNATAQGKVTARQDICVDGRRKTDKEILEEMQALMKEWIKRRGEIAVKRLSAPCLALIPGPVDEFVYGKEEARRARKRKEMLLKDKSKKV